MKVSQINDPIFLKEIRKKYGVYIISFNGSDSQYVGSTFKCLADRLSKHKMELRKNIHGNKHLQRLYDKYSESNMIFEVVEICDKEMCRVREQYYIDTLPNLVNQSKNVTNFMTGVFHKEETKKKISNSLLGRKHTQERINNMSKSRKGIKLPPMKESTKEKLRNRKHTPESLEKMSQTQRDLHIKNPNIRKKAGIKKRYKILCLENNNFYQGYEEVAAVANSNYGFISRQFQYKNEINVGNLTFQKIGDYRKHSSKCKYLHIPSNEVFIGIMAIREKFNCSGRFVRNLLKNKILQKIDGERV